MTRPRKIRLPRRARRRQLSPQQDLRVRSLGQATIEYILMLSIVVAIAVTLKGQLEPLLDEMKESLTAQFDKQLFGSFHRTNVGRVSR